MRRYVLAEDQLPPQFDVAFSHDIWCAINEICEYNRELHKNAEVDKFVDIVKFVKRYISHPSIAFDYANRYEHDKDNECKEFIDDLKTFNVECEVKNNRRQTKTYVYVSYLEIDLESFDLEKPPSMTDTECISFINEAKLRSIIHETGNRNIIALESLIDRITRQVISEMRRRQHRKRNKHKSRCKTHNMNRNLQKSRLMRKKSQAISKKLQSFIDDLSSLHREGH